MIDCREGREELGPVIFNPASGAYEACVTYRNGSDAERYSCALHFPTETDGDVVSLALIRQAREMREGRRLPLTSRLTGAEMRAANRARRRA